MRTISSYGVQIVVAPTSVAVGVQTDVMVVRAGLKAVADGV